MSVYSLGSRSAHTRPSYNMYISVYMYICARDEAADVEDIRGHETRLAANLNNIYIYTYIFIRVIRQPIFIYTN